MDQRVNSISRSFLVGKNTVGFKPETKLRIHPFAVLNENLQTRLKFFFSGIFQTVFQKILWAFLKFIDYLMDGWMDGWMDVITLLIAKFRF